MSNKNIAIRFAPRLRKLSNFIDKLNEENAHAVQVLTKEFNVKAVTIEDKVVYTSDQEKINIRLVLFNNPITDKLVQNITRALSMLPLPFSIIMAPTYFNYTRDGDPYQVRGSKSDVLPLKYYTMRNLEDLKGFMSEIGYEYTLKDDYGRNDQVLVDKIFAWHDKKFGFFSVSNFSFHSIAVVEFWINCDRQLVEQWQG